MSALIGRLGMSGPGAVTLGDMPRIGWFVGRDLSRWTHCVAIYWDKVDEDECEEGCAIYRKTFGIHFSATNWRGLKASLRGLFRIVR